MVDSFEAQLPRIKEAGCSGVLVVNVTEKLIKKVGGIGKKEVDPYKVENLPCSDISMGFPIT